MIKLPRKKKLFKNKVKGKIDIEFWAIQEHHLDSRSPRKLWFGRRFVFYGDGVDGLIGVLSIVNRDLEPKQVFIHPFGRVLGVQINWGGERKIIFNI